jgi:predicted transcriptional regulator
VKVTTVRLPDDLAEAVEEAADASERSQSEYIRFVLRNHFDSEPNTDAGADRVAELETRLASLESRFEALDRTGASDERIDAWRSVAESDDR